MWERRTHALVGLAGCAPKFTRRYGQFYANEPDSQFVKGIEFSVDATQRDVINTKKGKLSGLAQQSEQKNNNATHTPHTHTLTLTHTHTHSSALLPVETNTPLRCQVSLLPRRCWEERILRNTCPWRRMLRSCSRSACTKESSTANGKHMMSQSHSG